MRTLLSATIFVALAGAASAQNLNVDVGNPAVIPSTAYPAGGAQAGFWNACTSTVFTAQPLLDLAGAPSAATLRLSQGTQFDGTFNNAGTTGDDQQLMDDYQDGGTNPIWIFENLQAGNYLVYTYAWAPDGATFIDTVSCGTIDPPQNCGGVWPGTQTLGITYTLHHITVPAGGNIAISLTIFQTYTTVNGFQLVMEGTPATPECPGDTAALCPCSGPGGSGVPNPGSAGAGCANSSFPAGAILTSAGNALDNAGDTLVLTCSNMPGPGLFFQANGLIGPILNFNDGNLCAGSGIIRMGVVFPTAGVASYPGGLTPAPIHIAGAPVLAPTPTKHYQCWYRDITVGFCNTQGHNMSNGLALTWTP